MRLLTAEPRGRSRACQWPTRSAPASRCAMPAMLARPAKVEDVRATVTRSTRSRCQSLTGRTLGTTLSLSRWRGSRVAGRRLAADNPASTVVVQGPRTAPLVERLADHFRDLLR